MEKIELSNFIGQPCKSKLAYEFIPKKKYLIDLSAIGEKLEEKKIFIEINTPFLIVTQIDGTSISFFKSGKIMVKNTKKSNEARKIAEKFIEAITN